MTNIFEIRLRKILITFAAKKHPSIWFWTDGKKRGFSLERPVGVGIAYRVDRVVLVDRCNKLSLPAVKHFAKEIRQFLEGER